MKRPSRHRRAIDRLPIHASVDLPVSLPARALFCFLLYSPWKAKVSGASVMVARLFSVLLLGGSE